MPMLTEMRARTVSFLRRIPIPLLSILVGIACGVVVWFVLERVQPKALRQIFAQELQIQVDQQARETLIRFSNFVDAHVATTRLLANHRRLAAYLEPLYWFESDRPVEVEYQEVPPWLPDRKLWQSLVRPSHVLLVDAWGRNREMYEAGVELLPDELQGAHQSYLGENQVRNYLVHLGERPYLLVSEPAEDATGTHMGELLLVAPVDEDFLQASQQGISVNGSIVALINGDEQRVLASSDETELPPGSNFDRARRKFVVTAQSFSAYEGSDLNIQFATLLPRSSIDATKERVESVELQQRLIAALAFVSTFTIVFFLLSENLNRILLRISGFARQALGSRQPPPVEEGNQIFVVEEWMRQFIRLVREARDEMHRAHESEIQESKALQEVIMETALDPIITIDDTGHIIEFNSTAERVLGYSRDKVIGRTFDSLVIDPASRESMADMMKALPGRRGDMHREIRREMQAVKANGRVFPVEVAVKSAMLQRRTVYTVYMHDISQRKRAEEEIRSLAKFPSESPSPVLRVNRVGVIIYANQSSRPLLEYWHCEQGQTLPSYWRKRVTEVLDHGRDREIEILCENQYYSLLFAPVVDTGYVNIYGKDVTEIRHAERQAREHQQELAHVSRLSTMGEMATGLAHELNQPLSAIANYANGCIHRLQSEGTDTEGLRFALAQINSQAARAGEIIRRLRGLVAKQPPVRSVSDVNVLVQEVCLFVEFEARKAGVVIEQELGDQDLRVRVDIVQIEQVLLNLVRNALDALLEVPLEQRRLVVRTEDRGGGLVAVEVEDTGAGFGPGTRERLFDPFFTTKESGMGMGLVISRTIMEDHSGRIEAEQLEPRGTRFTAVLPGYIPAEKGEEAMAG